MGNRETVSEHDRNIWGDGWADVVEMKLRFRAVQFDPALSVELGSWALLNLADEYSTPSMTVWARLYGRPDVEDWLDTA